MIKNKEKLTGCNQKIWDISIELESIAEKKGTNLFVSSGKRDGRGSSWHDKGLAIDFYFENSNVFKYVSEIYYLCEKQEGVFKGVTEFEVCRGVVRREGKYYQWNHLHIAFGNEKKLECFTGVYK